MSVPDEPPPSGAGPLGFVSARGEPTSIDGIISALYGALSFERGGRPDFDALRDLFGPGARLIKVAGEHPAAMELRGFFERLEDAMKEGRITDLKETELARRTDVFGAIAQVFGTFERTSGDRTIRGINSIQLRNDGHRWWIESLMWSDERDDQPLPDAYLPRSTRGDEVKKRRRARTLRTQPYGPTSSR